MRPSVPTSSTETSLRKIPLTALLVILLGFVIRVYAFARIPLINPDGILYIQQARALHYGLWDSLTSCFHYLSNYPILIAGSYQIFGDWVLSGRSVSLFFGTLALVPLYGLLRCFFDETVSALTLLSFALLPTLIYISQDVMRGPVYWFFSLLGLYLFILQTEQTEKKTHLLTLFSSISFIMAAWARIEAVLFILISAAWLIFTRQEGKWRHLLFFMGPVALLCLGLILCMLISGQDALMLFETRILTMPSDVMVNYEALLENLASLVEHPPEGFSPYFFPKVRKLLWLIALGTVVVQIVETLFYLFFLILAWGAMGAFSRIKTDPRMIYLSVLSGMALLLLYCQTLYNWAMVNRFVAIFLFPAFVFMGLGIEKIIAFFSKKFKIQYAVSCTLVCLMMLGFALPKALRTNYVRDKLVFKEIGAFISAETGNRRAVSIGGNFKNIRFVHFYANLNYPGAPCFDTDAVLPLAHPDPLCFVREKGTEYFIWKEQKGEQGEQREMLASEAFVRKASEAFVRKASEAFVRKKEWNTSKLGKLILYKVMP